MRRFSLLLSVVVVLLSSAVMLLRPPAAAQDATPTSDLEANKALARRFHDEIFEQGNLAVADDILTPDFAWYSPPDQLSPITGPDAVKQTATDIRGLYDNALTLSDDEVIAEGDRVMIRWTLQGTAQTATGPVPVSFTGIDIFRVEDGKLSELRQLIDQAGLDQQLAAPPARPPPAAATPTP